MKPRQFTIYRNPQSAHKWTIENFLWTEEKQTVNSLNHGVDYFFNFPDVRAFLEKGNQPRTDSIFYGEGRPVVGPDKDKDKDRDRVGRGKGPSNIVIVESDTYTEYIDDSEDDYADNIAIIDVLPYDMSISLPSIFDDDTRSGVCGTSTSALPGLRLLHISTDACLTWTATSQPMDLTSSSDSSVSLQQNSVEVLESSVQDPSSSSSKRDNEEEFPKAGADGVEVDIEKRVEVGNGKEGADTIGQHEDILTDRDKAAGDRVTIDLNLMADVEVEVEVGVGVRVLEVTAINTQSSAVKESSSSSRYTDLSIDDSERVRAQEKLDLAYRRTAKRLSRGYVTHN